jgi:hypothetical protein
VRRTRLVCLIAATLAMAGCASSAPAPPAAPTTSTTVATTSPPPASPASPVPGQLPRSSSNPDAQAASDAALADAAAHLGVSRADLTLEQIDAREWGDSSLGCPRPGLLYSQVVTPGFLIVVTSGTKVLEYHADARGRVVLCKET